MTITVIPFASVKDILQYSSRAYTIEENTSVGDILSVLISTYPPLTEIQNSLLFAVNKEYATTEHRLGDGDELAIFPPVSGG